jgi:hypothetical protein
MALAVGIVTGALGSLVGTIDGGDVIGFNLIDLDPLKIGDYTVPQDASISISQQKIMSKTLVAGAKGTIKEMSGYSDWEIDIAFEFSGVHKITALSELKKIKKIWDKVAELPVVNSIFRKLGITHVVIEELALPDRDREHELPVQIRCSSDKEIDLTDPSKQAKESTDLLGEIGELLSNF